MIIYDCLSNSFLSVNETLGYKEPVCNQIYSSLCNSVLVTSYPSLIWGVLELKLQIYFFQYDQEFLSPSMPFKLVGVLALQLINPFR